MDDAPGTEAIAYYSTNMRQLTKYKGAAGEGSVLPSRFSTPHVILHNHPDGGTFSPGDILNFMKNENTLLLTAVGNNGSVFSIEKTPMFNVSSALRKYLKTLDKIETDPADWQTVARYMEEFLETLSEDGFTYRKG